MSKAHWLSYNVTLLEMPEHYSPRSFLPTHCIILTHLTASDFIYFRKKRHPQCIIYSITEMDSLGYDYNVPRLVVIYDTGLDPSKHTTATSVTVTTFIWITFKVRLLYWERELVTFISSPRQSVVLNDNSRSHIVKVEAFDYPCGCPRRKANCCSARLSTFGPVPSRALVS